MRHPVLCSCALGLLACLFSAGCRDREITTYRIPKEKAPETPAAAPQAMAAAATPSLPAVPPANMAGPVAPPAGGASLVWTAPSHWVSKAPINAMRRANYDIKGDGADVADLSISSLSGTSGGEFANINRWRGQAGIGLPPITEAELASVITRFESNGLKFALVDFTGTSAPTQRVIGAIVPFGANTWFFKLTGPAPLLAREQAAFNAFLKTIRVPAATP